jgi:diguanylate cyclase (GGDEF)-like protein
MYSLYYVVTDQHADEFAPVGCNRQTLSRLVRYFEDVVVENKLSALVIEGRCLDGDPVRDGERIGKLAKVARHLYLFTCDSRCPQRTWRIGKSAKVTRIEEKDYHSIETGPFVLVMDPRFCGMLASCAVVEPEQSKVTYEMVWTFDPNVVFTAIEYLMARMNAQNREERSRLEALIKACTPHSPSLRLALSLTTKLTTLMQRQNEREMAINSISSAFSSTLDLDKILQSAVDEVGFALKARRSALALWEEDAELPERFHVYEREDRISASPVNLAYMDKPADGLETSNGVEELLAGPAPLEIPVTYRGRRVALLSVEDETPGRIWEDEEILMVQTVSDQLAVAISHARLFKQMETQAMTDPLTGLYNHRYFQDRLERELRLAIREKEKVSLILLDLDHLKHINDTYGHRTGDACLRTVARTMQSAVREIDICARYGGEEFVIVLPRCDLAGALMVAERVRESIAGTPIEPVGRVTASIGVASFPGLAYSREDLIELADRAMYLAKAGGRNRVATLPEPDSSGPSPRPAETALAGIPPPHVRTA